MQYPLNVECTIPIIMIPIIKLLVYFLSSRIPSLCANLININKQTYTAMHLYIKLAAIHSKTPIQSVTFKAQSLHGDCTVTVQLLLTNAGSTVTDLQIAV